MLINDRLSTILPTVGAFRRRSMQVKWLSCKGLNLNNKRHNNLRQNGQTQTIIGIDTAITIISNGKPIRQ